MVTQFCGSPRPAFWTWKSTLMTCAPGGSGRRLAQRVLDLLVLDLAPGAPDRVFEEGLEQLALHRLAGDGLVLAALDADEQRPGRAVVVDAEAQLRRVGLLEPAAHEVQLALRLVGLAAVVAEDADDDRAIGQVVHGRLFEETDGGDAALDQGAKLPHVVGEAPGRLVPLRAIHFGEHGRIHRVTAVAVREPPAPHLCGPLRGSVPRGCRPSAVPGRCLAYWNLVHVACQFTGRRRRCAAVPVPVRVSLPAIGRSAI